MRRLRDNLAAVQRGQIIRRGRSWLLRYYRDDGKRALTLGSVVAFASVFPMRNANAVGAAAFDVSLLIGMLTALVHSSRTRAQ